MIGRIVNRFLALPIWARYTLIALSLPVLVPAFLIFGLLHSTHQIIEIFKE